MKKKRKGFSITNNMKVNYYNFLYNRKLKLVVAASSTLVVGGVVIFVPGCLSNDLRNTSSMSIDVDNSFNYSSNYKPSYETTENNTDVEQVYVESIPDGLYQEIISGKISIDASSSEEVKEEISKVVIEYDDSELLGIDNALRKYYSLPEVVRGELFSVDENSLYNTIKGNNTRFLSTKNNNIYKELPDSRLTEAVKIIARNINEKLASGYINDFNNLKTTLNELKVLSFSDFSTASTNDSECILALDLSSIENRQNQNPDLNVFERVVKHESNHIIQMQGGSALKGKPYETRYGICYKFSDLKINPLYNNWLFETCAEFDAADNDKYLFYENEIANLNSVIMSLLLKDGVDKDSLSSVMYGCSLDELFKLFDADTMEKKSEVIEMLYSFNMYHYGDNNQKELLSQKTGYDLTMSEYEEYARNLIRSSSLSLSKYFYSNLIEFIKENPADTKDVFTLVSLFENEIGRIVWYASDYRNNATTDFYRQYESMQKPFFRAICDSNGYDINDFFIAYDTFKEENPKYQRINFLDDDSNDFLKRVSEANSVQGKTSINKAYIEGRIEIER